jgi:hypothetical protein
LGSRAKIAPDDAARQAVMAQKWLILAPPRRKSAPPRVGFARIDPATDFSRISAGFGFVWYFERSFALAGPEIGSRQTLSNKVLTMISYARRMVHATLGIRAPAG